MTDLKRTEQPGLIEGDSSDEQRSNANARYDADEAAWQPVVDAGQSETTAAWMTADRAHLERLVADSAAPKRQWWWRRPLPWLVVRQYQRNEHVLCAHRWEWRAEVCARWRSRRHATQIGVFYTARHRTHIRDDRAAKRAES